MENNLHQLDYESVISFNVCTLKANKLLDSISEYLGAEGWKTVRSNLNSAGSGTIPFTDSNELFIEGIECEVLKPGQNWQKGKVKLKMILEFQPDELEIEALPENIVSELSLDDIRRKLNEVTA